MLYQSVFKCRSWYLKKEKRKLLLLLEGSASFAVLEILRGIIKRPFLFLHGRRFGNKWQWC